MNSLVCPCCKQDRPENEIIRIDDERNLWQCKICIMLNKEPCKGTPCSRAEYEARRKLGAGMAMRTTSTVKTTGKVVTDFKDCPGCLKKLPRGAFLGKGLREFRYCLKCRDEQIAVDSERAKKLLGGGIFGTMKKVVARCHLCGWIGDVESFSVDTESPTGIKHRCPDGCKGK